MVLVNMTFVNGSGTLPKDVSVGSIVDLDASPNNASTYEWEFLSLPPASKAFIYTPIQAKTKIGPLDTPGVYHLRLCINRNIKLRTKTITLSVPGDSGSIVTPPEPLFDTGGRVRNFSFELPGIFEGEAAYWDTIDDAPTLIAQAGTLRGRIAPANFNTTSGIYAFCLGDDLLSKCNFKIGEEFSISQDIDFTGMNILKFSIKYDK